MPTYKATFCHLKGFWQHKYYIYITEIDYAPIKI